METIERKFGGLVTRLEGNDFWNIAIDRQRRVILAVLQGEFNLDIVGKFCAAFQNDYFGARAFEKDWCSIIDLTRAILKDDDALAEMAKFKVLCRKLDIVHTAYIIGTRIDLVGAVKGILDTEKQLLVAMGEISPDSLKDIRFPKGICLPGIVEAADNVDEVRRKLQGGK